MLSSITVKKQNKLSKTVMENVEGLSYSAFMKSLRNKDVKVNGKRIEKDIAVNIGDKIDIYYTIRKLEKYTMIYKDENVYVVNKKSGYTSEEIFYEIIQENPETRFIHRLDRNTRGVMIFALNEESEKELLSGFKNRTFNKVYRARVFGKLEKKADTLTAYLVKDSDKSLVKIYGEKVKNGVEIKTGYKVIKEYENTSDLEVKLYTGKTHQIRAHLAYIGHPIVGDGKYGDNKMNKSEKVKTQMLDSYKLTLFFEKNDKLYYLNGKTFLAE